jgi:hypothetical protein
MGGTMETFNADIKSIYEAILTDNRSRYDFLMNECGNAIAAGKKVLFGSKTYKDLNEISELKKSLDRVYSASMNVLSHLNAFSPCT